MVDAPVICPVCELEVEGLVVDPFDGVDWEMCERCKRCTDIMDCDGFLTDPRFDLASLSETRVEYMRRMHATLLPDPAQPS